MGASGAAHLSPSGTHPHCYDASKTWQQILLSRKAAYTTCRDHHGRAFRQSYQRAHGVALVWDIDKRTDLASSSELLNGSFS